jgi:hypothetical protein
MAICRVSEKIQTAYVCGIRCAPWIFSLPCISPFWNGLHVLIFPQLNKVVPRVFGRSGSSGRIKSLGGGGAEVNAPTCAARQGVTTGQKRVAKERGDR